MGVTKVRTFETMIVVNSINKITVIAVEIDYFILFEEVCSMINFFNVVDAFALLNNVIYFFNQNFFTPYISTTKQTKKKKMKKININIIGYL